MFNSSKTNKKPYVTARPEVTYKSLTGETAQGQLKFIVMATDGREYPKVTPWTPVDVPYSVGQHHL
jgi:hypothetical protein